MDLHALEQNLAAVEAELTAALPQVEGVEPLKALAAGVTGKQGPLRALMGEIKNCPADQKGAFGQKINTAKARIEGLIEARRAALESATLAAEQAKMAGFDPTLPGRRRPMGAVHPVTAVQWEVERIFTRLGFTVEAGPEMESEFYNFEALNIPRDHPARDMQDTFWLTNGQCLRTQTSPVQVRSMQKFGPPLRIIAPGRCFRYETLDASHENTFHQVEGLVIDRNIGLPHLIALARTLLCEVMRREVKLRIRPGFFPFVEPGIEIDMNCEICGGSGCATCKHSGWVEVLPCGMVHPNVLRAGGINAEEWTGFAFGLGLTRLAMMKFGIRDIRVLNAGDLRATMAADRLAGEDLTGAAN